MAGHCKSEVSHDRILGGGKFVQRFMYLRSERSLVVSVRALGRVTSLDEGWSGRIGFRI